MIPNKTGKMVLARWLRPGGSVGWGAVPHTKRFAGSIPRRGVDRRLPIAVSLSHPWFSVSLSPFLSLKSMSMSLGEDLNKQAKKQTERERWPDKQVPINFLEIILGFLPPLTSESESSTADMPI